MLWSYKKFPKYGLGRELDQVKIKNLLRQFFFLSTVPMMNQISVKSSHLAQKCYFYQRATNKQS